MNGVFSSILGQAAAVRTLRKALTQGKVHHAYRFEGPSGVGKKLAATALAQSLLCTSEQPEGCGECTACRRAASIAEQAPEVPLHPDFIWVRRGLYSSTSIASKEATGISVEQVRKVVLGRTGYGSHEGRALVVFVEDAEDLTVSAANALLKTLEEPGPRVHFVLHTSRPHRLLDTLRSRSLAVRFGPLPDATVAELLARSGLDPAIAARAEGSMDRALQLANTEASERHLEWLTALDGALSAPHFGPSLELSRELPKNRSEVTELLQVYAQHLATRVRTQALTPDVQSETASLHAFVDAAVRAIEHNVNPTLAVEAMLVEARRHHPEHRTG